MQQLQQGATLQNGKYRIEKVLGQGGFGITYFAMRTDTGSQVAIKELFVQGVNDRKGNDVTISNPVYIQSFSHQKEKFSKEARRIHNIDNLHVVKVYDSFEENGTAYYAMQFIEGYSLGILLKNTIFSEEQAIDILNQLLDALSVIHSQNIWHLDIKPDNILLDNKGNVILIDFGASKHIEQNGTLTTSSSLAMTPGFAAPEQMQGDISKFGPWTDFYALGGTLYNIVTNHLPPSFDDIISEGSDAFHFASSISEEFQYIISWFMQPNRRNRPQSILEVIKLLDGDDRQIWLQERPRDIFPINGYNAIDLGLSVLWSTMDIGASAEGRYGDCFLWGDPNGKKTQRVLNSTFARWFCGGPSCNNIAGDIRFDTATNLWGSPWRMPSRRDFKELVDLCVWELLDNDHVKITGPNGNYIMLDKRWHWTSESPMTCMLLFSWESNDDNIYFNMPSADLRHNNYVDYIFPIRPVINKNNK